jgi:hypothetical protein
VADELPRAFHRIRLELARTAEHPTGDHQLGYELVVPLADDGTIDAALWREYRDHCRVRRFRAGEPDEFGHVVRHGGRGGGWAFRYDVDGEGGDEAGYRLSSERFVVGEYISIYDADDETLHAYQVVSAEHL